MGRRWRDRGGGARGYECGLDRRSPMASGGSHGAGVVRRIRASRRVTLALHAFPSPEWVTAYGAAINGSEDYRTASTDWTHGSVALDRKSTRLNSSHDQISYAVFCLKKKKQTYDVFLLQKKKKKKKKQ